MIIAVELDKIWNQHWNAEKVIFFQTVILQCVRLVSGARTICDHITSRPDLCNKGAYDFLVYNSYGVAEAFLGNNRRTQTQEKLHLILSNLVLCRKLRKSVKFICKQDTGGVFPPMKFIWQYGIYRKQSGRGPVGKHPPKRKPDS